ncbi:MAG: 5-(carboxyamino)imidazole ribonucleotide mutase [Oscillospiraceae bacterium]|nr:5-(carboxyamino)imidazole ribonucleotide mutase [Oscillospiraceae bacterium]
MMSLKKVLVVMGSDSDFPMMEPCFKLLDKFHIPFTAQVCSAHRSPNKAAELARTARQSGFGLIIAAAGLAAHLPGVIAAFTTLPVIGVPCKTGALSGVDALYAIVQMPSGVPVATVAIDGAANAAILAAQILSVSDDALEDQLTQYKKELEMSVELRNERLKDKLSTIGE